MQSSYTKLVHDLDAREKHILQLESELLRVDYEYGVVVKDLKQKYAKISQEFSLNHYTLKQLKKQKKRLQIAVANSQGQLQNAKLQAEDLCLKNKFQEQALKRAKQQNQMLRNQIKFMQNNQNKYIVKAQQANRKKDHYKEEILKLSDKVAYLEKQIKKSHLKRKELEELVEQEVLETHQRIQNIGIQFLTKTNLNQTQKKVSQNMNGMDQTIKNSLHNMYSSPKEGQKQVINDWESDMKKLKNCVDYGNSYMLMFDPMNFDRIVSREIFKFLRKCLKQIEELSTQLDELQSIHNNSLATHKQALQHLEQELQNISCEKKCKYTIDTQIQTDNPNSLEAQKAAYHLSQLNMKLKIKNTGLIQCVESMALRNAAVHYLLENAHKNTQYWKAKSSQSSKQDKLLLKPISKFRSIVYSILLTQMLSGKSNISKEARKKISRQHYQEEKIRGLCEIFQNQCPQNIEIIKLKEQVVISHEGLTERCSQIIGYYQFKLKNWVQRESVILPHKF